MRKTTTVHSKERSGPSIWVEQPQCSHRVAKLGGVAAEGCQPDQLSSIPSSVLLGQGGGAGSNPNLPWSSGTVCGFSNEPSNGEHCSVHWSNHAQRQIARAKRAHCLPHLRDPVTPGLQHVSASSLGSHWGRAAKLQPEVGRRLARQPPRQPSFFWVTQTTNWPRQLAHEGATLPPP